MSRHWISIAIIISVMVIFIVVFFVMDTYVVWPKSLCISSAPRLHRFLQNNSRLQIKANQMARLAPGTENPDRHQRPDRANTFQPLVNSTTQQKDFHNTKRYQQTPTFTDNRAPPLPPSAHRKKVAVVRLILSTNKNPTSLPSHAETTGPYSPDKNYVPLAPLWWDKDEGAYMIKLRLGAGPVELVLDTGSSQISAKGEGCLWTSCEQDDGTNSGKSGCTTKSCPCGNNSADSTRDSDYAAYALTGRGSSGAVPSSSLANSTPSALTDSRSGSCSDFFYHPTGQFVKPGEHDAGTKTTLVYGSQQDTISHYLDEVSLPCVSLSVTGEANTFVFTETPASRADDERSNNEYLLGKMIVHFVHHIEGESSSNLLGMARPPNPQMRSVAAENGRFVTVDKLLLNAEDVDAATADDVPLTASTHPASGGVWSVILKKLGGWFAIGSLAPLLPAVKYIDMVDPPQFDNFVTHFYITKIWSLEVGPRMNALVKIKKSAPQFCVFDTGTTYTYGCTKLGDQLAKLGYHETTWYIRLTLGSHKNALVTLTYSPRELVDPDFPTSSVFQCQEGRTLPDFDTIFPNLNVLLFGALMMQNCYWEFNLATQKIGVQTLAP